MARYLVLHSIMNGTLPDEFNEYRGKLFYAAPDPKDSSKHIFLTDAASFMRALEREGGTGNIMYPAGDHYVSIRIEAKEEKQMDRNTARRVMTADLFASGLASMLGGIMGSRDEDSEDDHENYTLAQIKAVDNALINLGPDGRVKIMPSNYRGDDPDKIIMATVGEYRRLKEMDMIDHCPVCTLRESNLVCHPDNGNEMADIRNFIERDRPNT